MHRVEYVPINDNEALQGFRDLTQIEGLFRHWKVLMRWLM